MTVYICYHCKFLDRNKYNKDKCMFLLYLYANAVNNNKGGSSTGDQQASGLAMEFSIKVQFDAEMQLDSLES